MFTFAIVAFAIAQPLARQNYVLPLDNMYASWSGSNGNYTLTATCDVNNATNYNSANMSVYWHNGSTSHFEPNGNWTNVTNQGSLSITGETVTFTMSAIAEAQGTIWMQYNGGPGDASYGAEVSFMACPVTTSTMVQFHRPGVYVPINDRVPSDRVAPNPISISFNLETPYTGQWQPSPPSFWVNTNNSAMFPGGGWQTLTTSNLTATVNSDVVTAQGNVNSNAGCYCVGLGGSWTADNGDTVTGMSGVIRTFTTTGQTAY